MLVKKTVEEFIAELASCSPAPGGGSTAALAGALGGALTSMVCNLTMGNAKYQSAEQEAKDILIHSTELTNALKSSMEEDRQAFTAVIAAYKLPKNTDEEKNIRNEKIQDALKEASLVPLKIAKLSLEIIKLADRIVSIGNKNAVSDAAVSAIMAFAGVKSALYNVDINAGLIKDAVFIDTIVAERNGILKNSEQMYNKVLAQADRLIAG